MLLNPNTIKSIKSVHKETTIRDEDSQVSATIDTSQRLGCLHRSDRCLSTRSNSSSIQEVPSFHVRKSGLPIHGLTFRNVPKSLDFHQTDGHNRGSFVSMCHLIISVPRQLTYKGSNSQQTSISHNILPSNSSKSRIHSKSKEVRFDTSSAIHLHRDGISDTTQHSQGTSRSHPIPTSDCQTISNSDSSFGTNFPFSFGQTQCSIRLRSPRQTSFTMLQRCLLSVWRSHILPLDEVLINSMTRFHLKKWMDTNHQGTSIHPPATNAFLSTDASHYGLGAHLELMRLSFHGCWMKTNPSSISIFWK